MESSGFQIFCAVVFALAIVHTFSTGLFERLAQRQPNHAGLWHFFGEVEAVFGIWGFVLILGIVYFSDFSNAIQYLDSRNFTEPMFVFAIMVIAASRPILLATKHLISGFVNLLPINQSLSLYVLILTIIPLVGSFITEPAAMTLAALMLRDAFFTRPLSQRLKYFTVGVLFVNVSIGGTLTSYAAPPVLMVASAWSWDTPFMLSTFGWKSAIAVFCNALLAICIFRKEIKNTQIKNTQIKIDSPEKLSYVVALMHLLFLSGVVVFAHHPSVFMAIFLFFLGYAHAYSRYQERLIIREGLMVAFFLAGLVVLGGQQQWWLNKVLLQLSPTALYYVSVVLTAITDNAALTYLGSLVEGVSNEFKYSLVAGAVTGGGLTVIANAPNPAGIAVLKSKFSNETVEPGGLFLAALGPTIVAILAFQLL